MPPTAALTFSDRLLIASAIFFAGVIVGPPLTFFLRGAYLLLRDRRRAARRRRRAVREDLASEVPPFGDMPPWDEAVDGPLRRGGPEPDPRRDTRRLLAAHARNVAGMADVAANPSEEYPVMSATEVAAALGPARPLGPVNIGPQSSSPAPPPKGA